MENEDDDPVGAGIDDPACLEGLTEMAVDSGLARAGDKLDKNFLEFAMDVAGLCAAIGDAYADDKSGLSAGDRIREQLCCGVPRSAYPSFRTDGSQARGPVSRFTEFATQRGLIRPGDKLDQNVVDFATRVVDAAASLGDPFGDSEAGGNAGEHIRAELYEG
ncbi:MULTISPECIES: hypothetical protein [unclassified Variovorax]|uniref:hypothetical protein n=1 Tax=unclassified Variovorax TaxID=663243 RepID=UPI00076DED5E|nr:MULTISPECIES: hypothetical protein [unclassified Variovorax]KWT98050.1 hypothetical protein APY03_0721 [Variovorax sp. WDL1]PNG50474.1 hypothetical protein CHC06_06098 [Variovorax sp. B2]PNG51347.1 hypothetical protein CHC07_06004 [Variovorax sp. B4]VTU43171.1 hypothetical protein H6P1_00376 [Variovorax sp. PBL-H6]VTU43396.1 hypothetical protein SRS16P1_00529 [Variovorax sp. SRS16]